MRKAKDGTNRVWSVIHIDENENTIFQQDFKEYDQDSIQKLIVTRAELSKPGDEITYGVSCDKYAFYTLFEVANKAGELKRLLINSSANFGRPVYKPFDKFAFAGYDKNLIGTLP